MSSEQTIRDSGDVDRALKVLDEKGYTYESEGALWFKTTELGDDKDRVLRKNRWILYIFSSRYRIS